jgi:hypothetical protein
MQRFIREAESMEFIEQPNCFLKIHGLLTTQNRPYEECGSCRKVGEANRFDFLRTGISY